MEQLLSGIKILDFSKMISGPFCTCLLGDMGAEVLKVEAPGYGEDFRGFAPTIEGKDGKRESIYFVNYNRNKKSITLNMKKQKSKEALWNLIKESDVIVENFKAGVMNKMGFGYDEVKKVKPDIIYASISGYGQSGPYSDRAGYDFIIQGMSGHMSFNGYPESSPVKYGPSMFDLVSGNYAALCIVAALRYKEHSGKGQYIDISMMDCAISYLDMAIPNYLYFGRSIPRIGNRHPGGGPHNTYKTKDGLITMAAGNPSLWKRVCEVIERLDLVDHPDFNTMQKRFQNVDQMDKIIEEWTMKHTAEEASKAFLDKDIPCGCVNNIEQAFADPHVQARQMVTSVDHPNIGEVKIVQFPIKFSDVVCGVRSCSPGLGEQNEEILCKKLGYSKEEVNQMQEP